LLIDTGADRTVFSAELLGRSKLVGLEPSPDLSLAGIGGDSPFVLVSTAIKLVQSDGASATFRGECAALTDPFATEFNILGRDLLNIFDVNLSRRREEVLLLTTTHGYAISTSATI
jgi:hypothetical protein